MQRGQPAVVLGADRIRRCTEPARGCGPVREQVTDYERAEFPRSRKPDAAPERWIIPEVSAAEGSSMMSRTWGPNSYRRERANRWQRRGGITESDRILLLTRRCAKSDRRDR